MIAKIESMEKLDKIIDDVDQGKKSVLIDFYTSWCAPCKIQHRVLEKYKEKITEFFPDIDIYQCDIEADDDLNEFGNDYRIFVIPQLALIAKNEKGSYMARMNSGVRNIAQILQFLSDRIENGMSEEMRKKLEQFVDQHKN